MTHINEHLIKISAGKAVFPHALEIGSEVLFAGKGTVTKIEDSDNFDGTYDRTYFVKIEYIEDMDYKENK